MGWRGWLRDGVALAVFCAVLLMSYHVAFARRVPPGYFLGTKHLVGMSESELRATLVAAFDNAELVSIHTGIQAEQRSLTDLGLAYDIDAMVQEILAPADPLHRVVADTTRLNDPIIVEGTLRVDDVAFADAVKTLADVLSVEPENPAPGFDEVGKQFVVQPGKSGTTITVEDIQFQLKASLAAGSSAVPIFVDGVAPSVSPTAVEQAVTEANGWLNQGITVDLLGSEQELPKAVIRSGITFVADTTVNPSTVTVHFDEEASNDAVAVFMKEAPTSERVIDRGALAKQIGEALRGKTEKIVASSYVPKPVVPKAKPAPKPTSSSYTSSGSFVTVGGSHDSGGSGRTVAYTVLVEEGLGIDADGFAAAVAATLGDERSWRGSGRIHFVRVENGGFPLYLASPNTVDRLCAPLDTEGFTSCSINGRVVINSDRWQGSSPHFTGSLAEYRDYVINHEVGHRIGFRHNRCSGSGVAPVMHQQTLGMNGCTPGPWPLDWERERVN
ncbi:MAG: DUF3152 domain-containing protein [Patescibacteria group bacterium]